MAIKTRNITSFDPYEIKKELIDLADEYFETRNIDAYESGFLGYFIQALTFLTSNALFHNSMSYNEAFLTKSVLPSTVQNFASQLDYTPMLAKPATCILSVAIPYTPQEDLFVKIPYGSKAFANDIPFIVNNDYFIKKDSNGFDTTVQYSESGIVENVPYSLEIYDGKSTIVCNLDLKQVNIFEYSFEFENPQLYQFYIENISGFDGQTHKIKVFVNNTIYREIGSIYEAQSLDKVYELTEKEDQNMISLRFGNGLYGFQPKSNDNAYVYIETTQGNKGNVSSNSVKLEGEYMNIYNGDVIRPYSYNRFPSQQGEDKESLENIKSNIISQISSSKKLSTEDDYMNFHRICDNLNIKAMPIITRRDLHANEVSLFKVTFDNDGTPIPTDTISSPLNVTKPIIRKGETISNDDGYAFKSPFTIIRDTNEGVPYARYFYSLTEMNIAPQIMSYGDYQDVSLGIRRFSSYLDEINQEDTTTYNTIFKIEVFKLEDMDPYKITGILKFTNTDGDQVSYNLSPSHIYADEITVILSTDNIDANELYRNNHDWKIELYWDGEIYNDFYGDWNFIETENLMDNKSTDVSPDGSYPFNVNKVRFAFMTMDTGRYYIYVDDTVPASEMDVNLNVNGKIYNNFEFYQTDDGNHIFRLDEDIDDFEAPVGTFDYTVEIVYDETSHTYTGQLYAIRCISKKVTDIQNSEGAPRIEVIRIGLSNIHIYEDTMEDEYIFDVSVTKMANNKTNKITGNLAIESTYPLSLKSQIDSNTLLYTTSVPTSEIPIGNNPIRIDMEYDGYFYSSYEQSLTIKQDLTNTCYSYLAKNPLDNDIQYAFDIPVISASYYEQNKSTIDKDILQTLIENASSMNKYKMATDRQAIKFAKTIGKIKNFYLNRYNDNANIIYNPEIDLNIELPPLIDITVYYNEHKGYLEKNIKENAKKVLYTFLQMKADFHVNIYRSEMARYLHDVVEEVEFCEINQPTKDIVFDFNLDDIPYTERYERWMFAPEFIWFDINKINITVKPM